MFDRFVARVTCPLKNNSSSSSSSVEHATTGMDDTQVPSASPWRGIRVEVDVVGGVVGPNPSQTIQKHFKTKKTMNNYDMMYESYKCSSSPHSPPPGRPHGRFGAARNSTAMRSNKMIIGIINFSCAQRVFRYLFKVLG